ncbi:BPI fold-containing family B member 4-like [Opisthocomus hoazin]|uniref:BPI fold-containing family B member 4-like n=1 Tax=Opisthocomus hoazin TaxID=30419 RepID=UPI003F52E30C
MCFKLLLAGVGHQVGFNTQLLVESTSAPGRALCVQVEADVDMLVQDKWAAPQSSKDCETSDINIRLRPKVPLLDEPLKRLLRDLLRETLRAQPGQILPDRHRHLACTVARARLCRQRGFRDARWFGHHVEQVFLGRGNPPRLRGAARRRMLSRGCNIINTRLNALSTLHGSGTRGTADSDISWDHGSWEHPPLPAAEKLSPLCPAAALPLGSVGDLPPFSIVSGDAILLDLNVPDSISLSTSALLPAIPQLAQVLPGSLPLELRVRVANEPVVAVRDGRATATLQASIDVFSPLLQSSQQLLFSIDTDVVLSIIPSVSDGKLQISLALDSIQLTRAPLRLSPLSVSPLAAWLKQVLAAAYVPAINDALRVSVPLPNVLSTGLGNARVDITDAEESADQSSLKTSCPGASSTLLAV